MSDAPALTRVTDPAQSHSVVIDRYRRTDIAESVYVAFESEWRGQPVSIQMRADRYTHSSGLSDWRIGAVAAISGPWATRFNDGGPKDLTDLARRRLAELAEPLVAEWLESEAYFASESRAYYRNIRGMAGGLQPGQGDSTADLRAAIVTWQPKLTPVMWARLIEVADAYDAFAQVFVASAEVPS